jgi:release factor glutamine methyltransferase
MPELDPGRSQPSPTLAAVLRELTAQLASAGIEEAGGDMRRLAAGALGISSADILRAPEHVLSDAQLEVLRAYAARRRRREPVSRILGERDFYSRTFAISPATLDPRPDSETVVATALEIAREEGWTAQPVRILDVGTGSGCLLLTLLSELPQATGLGTDICTAALAVAAANARRLGVAQRASWQQANGLENIAGPFHVLVTNPPYVRTADIAELQPEVRGFEPVAALDGGPDGLAVYRALVPRVVDVIAPGGWVVFEVGHDQADRVVALLGSPGTGMDMARIRIRRDVAGRRRCVAARTLR